MRKEVEELHSISTDKNGSRCDNCKKRNPNLNEACPKALVRPAEDLK